MVKLTSQEVRPGIIPFLSNAKLRQSRRCRTDAMIVEGVDRSTRDNHNFLVVKVDHDRGVCIATPMLSAERPTSKHVLLDVGLKRNFPGTSASKNSYYFREQFWEIPIDVLVDASEVDVSRPGCRRTYAEGRPEVLDAILADFERDGEPIRPLRPVEPSEGRA